MVDLGWIAKDNGWIWAERCYFKIIGKFRYCCLSMMHYLIKCLNLAYLVMHLEKSWPVDSVYLYKTGANLYDRNRSAPVLLFSFIFTGLSAVCRADAQSNLISFVYIAAISGIYNVNNQITIIYRIDNSIFSDT